ncbi:hypothetical protein PCASD_13441 [Puccinia coronata f. sp. avenae]|uniref:Conserved oligomeric Golgi complex subunit 8 n=1 Tax=Puccinia coronata f. sp. avenae TaxID=200324 RepID=A0A2N5T637_9BASI|nr:hypothetical protein PCASD_13441 [Puccinia coronata f. sp. avenae]
MELQELHLKQIKQLPNQLTQTEQTLQIQLATLCYQEVNTIIRANHQQQQIQHQITQTEDHLNHYIQTTQTLQHKIHHQFTQEHHHITKRREEIKTIRNYIQLIQQLIELPQLITTCIHNQHELEAIQLALKIPPPPPPPPLNTHQNQNNPNHILTNITQHAIKLLASIRDQHLIKLNHPSLSLSTAIRSIHIIRKLSSQQQQHQSSNTIHIQPIHEPELRLAFLSSRFITLQHSLNPSPSPPPPPPPSSPEDDQQHHLKLVQKSIEIWRTHVGETMSIYHHIFQPITHTTTPTTRRQAEAHTLTDADTQLNLFLTQAVRLQEDTLRTHVQHIRGVSGLAAVLTQLTYSGAAFRKWGLDFSATSVGPIIVHRLEQLVSARFHGSAQLLIADLKPLLSSHSSTFTSSSTNTAGKVGFISSRRRSLHPFSSSLTHASSYWTTGLSTVLIAPNAMAQVLSLKPTALAAEPVTDSFVVTWISLFPPLVRYVNAQLAALNELRLLPLAGSYSHMVDAQMDALATATRELGRLAAALPPECSSSSEEEEEEQEVSLYQQQQHPPDEAGEHTEDLEKRSLLRLRSVVYRLLLLWARNILPALEHALRVHLYHQLNLPTPPPPFLDLINQAEAILLQHFQSLHASNKLVMQQNPCSPMTPNNQTDDDDGRKTQPTPDPSHNIAHSAEMPAPSPPPAAPRDDDPLPDTRPAAAENPARQEGPAGQDQHAATTQVVVDAGGPPAGEDG